MRRWASVSSTSVASTDDNRNLTPGNGFDEALEKVTE